MCIIYIYIYTHDMCIIYIYIYIYIDFTNLFYQREQVDGLVANIYNNV